LRQLFNAAEDLNIPRDALNELLLRSPSTSSRMTNLNIGSATLTRTNSNAVRSPTPSGGSTHDRYTTASGTKTLPPTSPTTSQRAPNHRDGDTPSRVVVRRTLIFPSDTRPTSPGEASPVPTTASNGGSLFRKISHRKRASEGGLSIRSAKSLQDRIPTPPPSRLGGIKRFSNDSSPPVPQMPSLYSNFLEPGQGGARDRSNSSLYDLYADGRGTPSERERLSSRSPMSGALRNGTTGIPTPEPGTAVEVLELSNGQVVWNVVNGLRAMDDYDYDIDPVRSRTSFSSDYSGREARDTDVQVLLREHRRLGSKGSATSSVLNRRPTNGQSRPETKVFYSDPQHVGRLIESITHGMQAGSISFVPPSPAAPSFYSEQQSDGNWTSMEEHLEHMLGSLASAPATA